MHHDNEVCVIGGVMNIVAWSDPHLKSGFGKLGEGVIDKDISTYTYLTERSSSGMQ